ncbi:MAG: hypothetical protein QW117_03090 [Candidatus Pacearchaeota archaeon]
MKKKKLKLKGVGIGIAREEDLSKTFAHLKRITLKEAEENKYKFLGGGAGTSFEHCCFMGLKYCKDFRKKAKYYVVVSDIKDTTENAIKKLNQGKCVVIRFYGDRKK